MASPELSKGDNPSPGPAGHTIAGQDAHLGTHIGSLSSASCPPGPFPLGHFPALSLPQPEALQGVSVTQGQDLALDLIECHKLALVH